MKYNIPVKEIMSTKLKTLHPKDKLRTAKETFDKYDIHHLPVHVMGDIKGIISLGDILFLEGIVNDTFDEFLKNKRYETITIDEVMTHKPYCVNSSMMLSEVLEVMVEKRVNALPVKEDNDLVGIVTSYDIIKYLKTILKS